LRLTAIAESRYVLTVKIHLATFLALCFLLAISQWGHAGNETTDNRWPKYVEGTTFAIDPPDEVEVLDLIRVAQKPDLSKAMQGLRMEWHGKIALKDDDDYLYLFDSSFRMIPGTTSRVLVLLDMRRHFKTWAKFNANVEAYFGYGTIVQEQKGTNTYLITVNTSGQHNGLNGALFFEKYAIFPNRIEKRGENTELTVIPD
jgi:hypothetical protein